MYANEVNMTSAMSVATVRRVMGVSSFGVFLFSAKSQLRANAEGIDRKLRFGTLYFQIYENEVEVSEAKCQLAMKESEANVLQCSTVSGVVTAAAAAVSRLPLEAVLLQEGLRR